MVKVTSRFSGALAALTSEEEARAGIEPRSAAVEANSISPTRRQFMKRIGVRDQETTRYLSHSSPMEGIKSLIPALVGEDITTENSPYSASSISSYIASKGGRMGVSTLSRYARNFSNQATRDLSNSDIIRGKEPLYSSVSHFKEIYDAVVSLRADMISEYRDRSDLLAVGEMEDLPKITVQQWKPHYWWVTSPISTTYQPGVAPALERMLKFVLDVYYDRLKKSQYGAILGKPTEELILEDFDPKSTMTGAPFFAAGDQSQVARTLMLKILDPQTLVGTGVDGWSRCLEAMSAIRINHVHGNSPCVSTRMGPLKKPVPLWFTAGTVPLSKWSATGLYNRTRFVFPAPYHINFLLSPLYVQLSAARKSILGLWHDPESADQYVAALRKRPNCYAVDFSGMDTSMSVELVTTMFQLLSARGFNKWSSDFGAAMYPTVDILMPSIIGEARNASALHGAKPWASGYKLTSEFDTWYGLAVVLAALDTVIPDASRKWASGEMTIAELGDDVIFTTDKPMDVEAFSAAASVLGATLEVKRDAMFLKQLLPLDPAIPHRTRSFARALQQIFFNEDRYSGTKGGTRPDAILRLGLAARCTLLKHHPDFGKWMPKLLSIINKLEYMKSATPEFISRLGDDNPWISQEDVLDVISFSALNPNFVEEIEADAYSPSAAYFAEILKSYGVSSMYEAENTVIRAEYLKALQSRPTEEDVSLAIAMTRPNWAG